MLYALIIIVSFFVVWFLFGKLRKTRQLGYIERYQCHSGIFKKFADKHTQLSSEEINIVAKALRDYFYICNLAGRRRMVSMPSQAVDDMWHEFILFTREYKLFCEKGLGRFIHHTPAEAMPNPHLPQRGIKRAWRLACAKEGINPKKPNRLPLLFAIDSRLEIGNGFVYDIDCKNKSSPAYGSGYCAGDIGCASGCGGDSGSDSNSIFDSDSGCGGDSGCSGGCGGD